VRSWDSRLIYLVCATISPGDTFTKPLLGNGDVTVRIVCVLGVQWAFQKADTRDRPARVDGRLRPLETVRALNWCREPVIEPGI